MPKMILCQNSKAENDDDSGYAMDGGHTLEGGGGEWRRMEGGGKMVKIEGEGRIYCHQCKCPIGGQGAFELAVTLDWAPSNCPPPFWHPSCFVCVECKDLLLDLVFFAHNQNVFCAHHFAELFGPKCAECGQLIISGEECTQAEGRLWHFGHFCCANCRIPLGGHQYLTMDNGPGAPHSPCAFCLPCFRLHLCQTCSLPIPSTQPHIAQANFRWHPNAQCFCCSLCQRPLLGVPFSLQKGGLLFCSSPSKCAIPTIQSSKSVSSSQPHSPDFSANSHPKSRLAVHFIGKKANAQMPPPLPMGFPPPIPVSFHSNFANSNSIVKSSENIYETLISEKASTKMATSSSTATSSGCSANGSICSSAAGSRHTPVKLVNLPMPNADILALSSSTEEEEKPIGRVKMQKSSGRRRWRSAEGRKGREKRAGGRMSPSPAECRPSNLADQIRRRDTLDGHPPPLSAPSKNNDDSSSAESSSSDSEECSRSLFLHNYFAALAAEGTVQKRNLGRGKKKRGNGKRESSCRIS